MAASAKVFKRLFSAQAKLKTNPIENHFTTNELRIKLNDDFATVTYKKVDGITYDLIHSSIPKTYQGQGLGSILAERIFEHLVQNNNKIKVSCEYLQKYAKSNRDRYKDNLLD